MGLLGIASAFSFSLLDGLSSFAAGRPGRVGEKNGVGSREPALSIPEFPFLWHWRCVAFHWDDRF